MSDDRWGDLDDAREGRDDRRERDERRGSGDARQMPHERPRPGIDRLSERREVVSFRGRDRLNERDVELMRTVGTFRAVYAEHLRDKFRTLDAQVRHLCGEGVLAAERMHRPDMHGSAEVLTLTREGHRFITAAEQREQRDHWGLVQPRELHHDAHLYCLVALEEERAKARGARVERVRLDDELKHEWWSREVETLSVEERAAQLEIGIDEDGRAVFPDVQIDIREADGTLERYNLELVTRHYNSRSIHAKTAAGFRMFRLGGGGNRHARGGDLNRSRGHWGIVGG